MSMLQASGRVNKTLVVAIALAGGGVMLYYGYTKLKSKKSRGPPTTRKLLPVLSKESKDKGAESGPLKASGSGDTASQVHAPSTDHAEESIVEECSRPTCEIKPRDKIKLETGPVTEKETTVTSPLSESSFERAYLTKQAQLQAETSVSQPESLGVEELSGPQSESPGESFEKISLSQVESDLSKQKLETADTAGDSQQSVLEAADTVADPQQSLLEAADTAVDTVADTVADIGDDTAADTASEPQQLLLEAADAAADTQQSLQSSAYEKLSLSQFQSAGDTMSDEDKSADSEGSGPGQSEGATSSEPSVQDVHSSLGEQLKSSVMPLPQMTVSAVGDGSLSITDDNDIIVFGRPEQQEDKVEYSGEGTSSKEPQSVSGDTSKREPGFEKEEQCSGNGHCGEEDRHLAGGEEEELALEAEPEEVSSLVFVPHPADRETFVDFGMRVTTTWSSEMLRLHAVVDVLPGGMAEQLGLNGGEMLYRLNGMLVSRWSNDILLQQFRVIIPAAFQLTFIKPVESKNGDPALRMTKVSAAVYEDDGFVQVQVFSSTDRVSSDETEPLVCVNCSSGQSQLCFVEHRSSQTALSMQDCLLAVDTQQPLDPTFDLTQVVFDLVDKSDHHCCVFVKDTSDKDVDNCMVVTDRNHVAVTTMDSGWLETNAITSTDPRFFFIHTIAESVCFESTELLDHYLAVRDREIIVKFVGNVAELNMDPEVQFYVKSRETLQSS